MFMRFLRLFFCFVLAGCGGNGGGGNPPLPDNTTTVIFEHDGLQRSALIYTPKGYDSSFCPARSLKFSWIWRTSTRPSNDSGHG